MFEKSKEKSREKKNVNIFVAARSWLKLNWVKKKKERKEETRERKEKISRREN